MKVSKHIKYLIGVGLVLLILIIIIYQFKSDEVTCTSTKDDITSTYTLYSDGDKLSKVKNATYITYQAAGISKKNIKASVKNAQANNKYLKIKVGAKGYTMILTYTIKDLEKEKLLGSYGDGSLKKVMTSLKQQDAKCK